MTIERQEREGEEEAQTAFPTPVDSNDEEFQYDNHARPDGRSNPRSTDEVHALALEVKRRVDAGGKIARACSELGISYEQYRRHTDPAWLVRKREAFRNMRKRNRQIEPMSVAIPIAPPEESRETRVAPERSSTSPVTASNVTAIVITGASSEVANLLRQTIGGK